MTAAPAPDGLPGVWRLPDLLSSAREAFSGDPVVPVGAGLVAVAVLLAGVALTAPGASRTERSLRAIEGLGSSLVRARDIELDRPTVSRVLDPLLRLVVAGGRRLTPAAQARRIERRIELAGSPADWDVDRVVALQVMSVVLGAAVGVVVGTVVDAGLLRTTVLVALGVGIGWLAPSAYVSSLASARSAQIRRELPDSLDLLTISVEAGLGFDAALAYVARDGRGPVAREFARMLQEMQIGTGRPDALRALAARTDVPELQSFAGALVQAESFGVPMSRALRVQSDEMRVKRRQRAEEQAQRVPVKILFPLIFGILPVLFIVIIGPAAVRAAQSFGVLG